MIAFWYCVVTFMLVVYVVLDGRNFGAGIMHWIVARTPEERRQVIAAIGPLWSWDEVWLIAFGGTLVAVFPNLIATAFAGYYLALFLILWCLLLRAMALELGAHLPDPMWRGFWDFVLVVSSLLLAILFGAAGGNMARGVPLDENGNFTMAFFTDFGVRGNVGLLDWYTVSVGVFSAVMLAAHGATYLTLKTDGPVHDRADAWSRRLWLAMVPLMLVVSLEGYYVRPQYLQQAATNPMSWLGLLVVIGSAVTLFTGLRGKREMQAFLGSNFLIAGMLVTGAATIFPVMLYSTLDPKNSLTAYQVASGPGSLWMAAIWWPLAFALTIAYFIFISRRYVGKVSVESGNSDHH